MIELQQKCRWILISILVITTGLQACKKDPAEIGVETLPEEDIIKEYKIDTLTLNTYLEKTDSVFSLNRVQHLVGSFNDPVFGYSKAGFAVRFDMSATLSNGFENVVKVDSAILTLNIANTYGYVNTEQNMLVYELNENFNSFDDTVGYSNLLMTDKYYIPAIADTSYYIETKNDTIQDLKIKLSKSFAEKIIYAESSNFQDNEAFQDFFKGLYISCNTQLANNIGGIISIDLSAVSEMMLYYTISTDTTNAPQTFSFKPFAGSVNIFEHGEYPSNIQAAIDDTPDSILYMQAMGGLHTIIEMPDLSYINETGTHSINRAELLIPVESHIDTDINSVFTIPQSLAMYVRVDDDINDFVIDAKSGTVFNKGLNNNCYKYNIPLYSQQLLENATTNNKLILYPEDSPIGLNPYRFILKNTQQQPIKLIVVYTKL